ncbi:hypothetical protein [Maridesulfovibrio sp.]|uniref:hypothetical protein n=1 Tax=Maridesulfovibrio sp. TaxID=2795000 RepID=UPI003B006591
MVTMDEVRKYKLDFDEVEVLILTRKQGSVKKSDFDEPKKAEKNIKSLREKELLKMEGKGKATKYVPA